MEIVRQEHATKDEWLGARSQGIGASEVAAALGLSSFQGDTPLQLYLRKRGEAPPVKETQAMRMGNLLEPVVASLFEDKTSRTISDPGSWTIFTNAEFPYVFATPDRFQVKDPKQGRGNLQLKTTSLPSQEWERSIPMGYRLQVQVEMLCSGVDWGSIACLARGRDFYGPDEYPHLDYVLDEQLIQHVAEKVEEFWKRVKDGRPPEPDHRDLDIVKQMYPASDPEKVVKLDRSVAGDLESKWAAKNRLLSESRELEKQAKTLESQIRSELKDADQAVALSGTFHWTTVEPSEVEAFTRKGYRILRYQEKEESQP